MEKLYTVNQVAEMFSVHPNTIWRWVREGKLKSIKLSNGKTRFSESELKKYIGNER